MKLFKRNIAIKAGLILGVSLSSLSFPALASEGLIPYLGMDAKQNKMEFKQSIGDIIQTNYPQGSFFGGIRVNEHLALELGYESTVRKAKTSFVSRGDNFLGTVNPFLQLYVETKTRVAGLHINIVGFYPVFEQYDMSLFGSFGLANLRFKSQATITIPGAPVGVLFFSKKKLCSRITLGIQHMVNGNLGARITATWEKTSSFKNIYPTAPSPLYMQPKDSRSLGVGIFYNF